MHNVSPPFLVCHESVASLSWNLMLNDEYVSEEMLAEEWGPSGELVFESEFALDWSLLLKELQLVSASLAVCIEVGTGRSSVPWILDSKVVHLKPEENTYPLTVVCDNSRLFGRAVLDVRLVLSEAAEGEIISPQRVGDILWKKRWDFSLDAGVRAFQVTAVNFDSLSIGNGIRLYDNPWFFDWSVDDWDYDVSAAVHLYVNKKNEDFFQRFTAKDPLSLRMMNADLIFQVCSAYIHHNAHDVYEVYHPGSLGWQAYEWITSMWGDTSLAELKARLLDSPSVFSAECMKLASV